MPYKYRLINFSRWYAIKKRSINRGAANPKPLLTIVFKMSLIIVIVLLRKINNGHDTRSVYSKDLTSVKLDHIVHT